MYTIDQILYNCNKHLDNLILQFKKLRTKNQFLYGDEKQLILQEAYKIKRFLLKNNLFDYDPYITTKCMNLIDNIEMSM